MRTAPPAASPPCKEIKKKNRKKETNKNKTHLSLRGVPFRPDGLPRGDPGPEDARSGLPAARTSLGRAAASLPLQ